MCTIKLGAIVQSIGMDAPIQTDQAGTRRVKRRNAIRDELGGLRLVQNAMTGNFVYAVIETLQKGGNIPNANDLP